MTDLFGNPLPPAPITGSQSYLMDTRRTDAPVSESPRMASLRAAATKDAPMLLDAPKTPRQFYKCADCLSVVAINHKLDPYVRNFPVCGLCGGKCHHMGEVKADNLVKIIHRCPCDHRCTGALGPSCDCKCGGANHGTHALVQYETVEGKVSRINTRPNPAALAIANEWRAAIEPLKTRLDDLYARKRIARLSERDYSEMWELGRIINIAQGYKTHKSRMETLTRYAERTR